MFVKGDKRDLNFVVKFDGQNVTPQTDGISGIKIQVGNILKYWKTGDSGSEITYDTDKNAWAYPLAQGDSLSSDNKEKVQAQVKINNEIFTTRVVNICVHENIIRELWL